MDILLLFFILLGYSFLGGVILKKNFEDMIPICCMGIVLFIYILGIFKHIYWGVISVVIILFLCSFLGLIYVITTKGIRLFFCSISKFLFSVGTISFMVISVAIIILNYGRKAMAWDEFSHWMDSPAIMTAYDDFGSNPITGAIFGSYPPAMSIFQYFFQKLHQICYSVGFSEWRCYFAYQILILAIIMPGINSVRNNNKVSIIRLFSFWIGIVVIPLVFYPGYLTKVYIDPFVAIVTAAGMVATLFWKDRDYLYVTYISLLVAILTLSKDVGLLFALFIVILNIANDEKRINTIAPLVSTLMSKLSWIMVLKVNNTSKNFSDSFDFNTMMNIIMGRDNTYRSAVYKNYIDSLFSGKLSYFLLTVILLGLGIIGLICLFKNKKITKKQAVVWSICLLLQIVIYIIGMGELYLFKFGEYEATNLASLDRYLGMVYLPLLVVVMSILVSNVNKDKLVSWEKCGILGLLLIVGVMIKPNEFISYLNRASVGESIEYRQEFDALAEAVQNVCERDSKIYYVAQESTGKAILIMKYLTHPVTYQNGVGSISEEPGGFYENDIHTVQIDRITWLNQLIYDNYDYVCIGILNEYFIEHYGECFESVDDIVEHGIYRVDRDKSILERIY